MITPVNPTVNQMNSVGAFSPSAQLSIRNVTKVFHGKKDLFSKLTGKRSRDFVAIENISLDIEPNTFVSIIGPSGCGKSTLLNIVAGLSPTTEGEILLNGMPITGPGPDRGMVFQNYALMPWMTVEENIKFAVETVFPKLSAKQMQRTVKEHIQLVGLTGAETKHSHELSGGMRQRVGIARALAINPPNSADGRTLWGIRCSDTRISARRNRTHLGAAAQNGDYDYAQH